MSIGYKKITDMIELEVNENSSLNKKQKQELARICKKIYMIEASVESIPGSNKVASIMGEVSLMADKIQIEGSES